MNMIITPADLQSRHLVLSSDAADVRPNTRFKLGFDPVDTGGLDESWRQQPGTPVYKGDFNAEGVREGLAKVNRKRPSQFHATETSHATLC